MKWVISRFAIDRGLGLVLALPNRLIILLGKLQTAEVDLGVW